MDGLTLLGEVSEAYGKLQTLAVEAALIDESGDENANSRSERRVRFCYAAPNRMRYEPSGRNGVFEVLDGAEAHRVFQRMRGGQRYSSRPIAQEHGLPHRFHPGWPAHDGLMVHGSPVRFWVDQRNRMVMRQEGTTGHRMPTEEEVAWSRHRMVVREMRVNEPLAEETFQFTPPENAEPETGGRCGISIGGGGGFVQGGPDDQHRLEHRAWHEWQGETLVERSRRKLRGMLLNFERRLTFLGSGTELRVDERVTGPKGEAETTCKLLAG